MSMRVEDLFPLSFLQQYAAACPQSQVATAGACQDILSLWNDSCVPLLLGYMESVSQKPQLAYDISTYKILLSWKKDILQRLKRAQKTQRWVS